MNRPITASLIGDGDAAGVRLERAFDTTVDDLWNCLTDPARLARWIGTIDGDLHPGGTVRLAFTTGWEGEGRIRTCEPPRRLVLDTTSEDGPTTITAELRPASGGAVLCVEETGLPVDGRANYAGGWWLQIEDLATVLDGGTPADLAGRWPALKERLSSLVVDER